MLIMMPCDEIATNDAIEFTFSRTAYVRCIRIIFSIFDEKLSPETDNYPSGVYFCLQDLSMLVITCNTAGLNTKLHREFHHRTS